MPGHRNLQEQFKERIRTENKKMRQRKADQEAVKIENVIKPD
jgi:hypothetical protein